MNADWLANLPAPGALFLRRADRSVDDMHNAWSYRAPGDADGYGGSSHALVRLASLAWK
jgi:hypothetical protein